MIFARRRCRVSSVLALSTAKGVPFAVGVGERLERRLGFRVFGERVGELSRDVHLARRGVEFDLDIELVAGGDPGPLAHLGADRQHERAAHPGDRGAVGVARQRHPHRGAVAPAERGDDVVGHVDSGGGLAAELNRGWELHFASFP
jgi:hypothetical protein